MVQSPGVLNESLQTALNLGALPELVQDLIADLTDVVRERTRSAFDVASLMREVGSRSASAIGKSTFASSYLRKGDKGQGLSAQDAPKLSALVWKRLATLLQREMPAVCKKVYTLEKVLRLKSSSGDTETLLEEALTVCAALRADRNLLTSPQVLGDKPSLLFWRTLAEALELGLSTSMQGASVFLLHETLISR